MSKEYKLRKRINNWKGKAIERGNKERYLRKENSRLKRERDKYKKDAREAKKQLEQMQNTPSFSSKEDLIYIVLQLFILSRIGFRAISKVLEVLGGYLGISKAPCTQTIINWVTRLSISRVHNPSHLPNDSIWIIDASIGLGSGKILAVLALDVNHHAVNEGAPSFKDISCVAVSVAESWTGETIAAFLKKIISAIGNPVAYLKDGGKDLAKAIRILVAQGIPSPCIDDVSHIIANILKHEYKGHPMFEVFTSACSRVSKKLKQTILACLAPPKVSTKARFMNLHRLVNWADKLLKHSPKGRAASGSILAKLRASIDQIPECKAFIRRFLRDANPLLECQAILKNKGLSIDTYGQCQKLMEALPLQSSVRIGFSIWLDNQLMVAAKLGLENSGMPVSSDNIESLFGLAKQHGTGQIKDANRIALRIPAMCGDVTRQDAQRVLDVGVKEQQEVAGSLPSLTKQRRQVLPNPGCLETILSDEEMQNLELIPRAKNWSKNLLSPNISDGYEKSRGPLADLEKQAKSP